MPPTFKDSSAVFSSSEDAARPAGRVAGGAELSNQQPVALEVPVTVNAARAVDGSEKREPFSEKTSTVLVFANGAVIRLSSLVAPGQLLFLINEKTRKEVVCQVVQSKNDRNVSGYVELEFTQPALGFWGMRFPGERSALPASAALDPAAKAPHTLAAGPKGDAANPAAHVSVKSAERNPGSALEATVESDSDFKTEIKADSRPLSKADLLAPAETSTETLKLETNRLQEQLSALLFAEEKASESQPTVTPPTRQKLGEAAAQIIEMAESEDRPAPKSEASPAKTEVAAMLASPRSTPAPVQSSFDDEEVQIPAWLEPLARNAAIPAPPESEETAPHLEERHTKEAKETPLAVKASTASSKRSPAPALVAKTLFGESAPAPARPRRSSKGIWIGIAASLLVAAASGAWYFRDALLPAHSAVASNTAPIGVSAAALPSAPPATASPVTQQAPLQNATPETSLSSPKASASDPAVKESASSVSPGVPGKMQTAAISERIPRSDSNADTLKTSAKTIVPDEGVEPEVKRPSLGKVRLAKPKVGRTAKEQVSGEMEPALEAGDDALSSSEPSLSSGLTSGSEKQPAAPAAPVGGEVKSARMISSVPPAYPALARTQHVAGDVRIDALIDATGRVTTMKVVAGPTLLQQAAMDALRQWKYQPATLDGKAVPMHLTVTIQFRLK